jgi:hypothetical protein
MGPFGPLTPAWPEHILNQRSSEARLGVPWIREGDQGNRSCSC